MSHRPTRPAPQSRRNDDMAEKAFEMVCLAALFFKHAGRPVIAERLKTAVAGWQRDEDAGG